MDLVTDSMLTVALRTAGRLIVRGVFTTAQAAAFIRWAWTRHEHAFAAAPSESAGRMGTRVSPGSGTHTPAGMPSAPG